MILDVDALGVLDRVANRMQLLGDVNALALVFDHRDNRLA